MTMHFLTPWVVIIPPYVKKQDVCLFTGGFAEPIRFSFTTSLLIDNSLTLKQFFFFFSKLKCKADRLTQLQQ